MKIYWASDDVDFDFERGDSRSWSIDKTSEEAPNPPADEDAQEKTRDGAIVSRYMEMILYFDDEVKVSGSGNKVQTAGKIKGDGLWLHAVAEERETWYGKNKLKDVQIHPDFIWRPESINTPTDYGNKYVTPENVYRKIMGKSKAELNKFLGKR